MHFRKRLFILLSIPLGIIFILSAGLLFLKTEINKKITEAQSMQTQFLYWMQTTESLASLRKDLKTVEPYLEQVDKALLQRDDLIGFPKDMTDLGSKYKLNISAGLGNENLDQNNSLRRTEFVMSAVGSLQDIASFLKDLESGKYIVKVANIDLTREDANFRLSLTGVVFSL